MNSELKRVIVTAALAAAAFNASAPADHAFPAIVTGAATDPASLPTGADGRPARIRIERCGPVVRTAKFDPDMALVTI